MFTLILLASITVTICANDCSSKYYEEIRRDGPSLPPDEIISRHNVEESAEGIKCYSLCTAEPMCVGFNYRMTANKTAENCQLTNVTKRRKTTDKGVWILLRDVEATKKGQERSRSSDSRNSARIFESEILRDEPLEFTKQLEKWLNNAGTWSICWRSKRDGNTSAEFHVRCDGKIPTLTFVKVINNNKSLVFGGYATKSWAANDDNVAAPGSFLFSLRNNDDLPAFKAPLKSENDKYAIQRYADYGPIFGGGIDLLIEIPGKSSSSFGYTYQAPNTTANKKSILAGSEYFVPEEVEVLYLKKNL